MYTLSLKTCLYNVGGYIYTKIEDLFTLFYKMFLHHACMHAYNMTEAMSVQNGSKLFRTAQKGSKKWKRF